MEGLFILYWKGEKRVRNKLLWLCSLIILGMVTFSTVSFAEEQYIKVPIHQKFDPKKGGQGKLSPEDITRNKQAGIIMLDEPYYPKNVKETEILIEEYKDIAPNHTGWSAETYTCERKLTHYEHAKSPVTGLPAYDEHGKPVMKPRYASTWNKDEPSMRTDHKRDVVKLPNKAYTKQLKEKYGHLEKEYGIDFATAEGELYGTGAYWSIYGVNTKQGPADGGRPTSGGDCETGARAYWYNDNDIIMEGFVLVPATAEVPNLSKGAAKGEAYWELRRDDRSKESNVHIYSKFAKAGKHYAVKTSQHRVKFNGQTVTKKGDNQEIKLQAPGLDVKGTYLEYEFTYDYTNHKKLVCSGTGDDRECWYEADWSKGKTFKLQDKIKIDSKQKDTIQATSLEDIAEQKYLVGRKDTWNPAKRSTAYHESIKRATSNKQKSSYDLISQSTLPVTSGLLTYEVELPSKEHEKSNFQPLRHELTNGYTFPVDIDDSLKREYANKTKWSYADYAFPVQQHIVKDKKMNGKQRVFEWDYVTDAFFISKFTGFIVGIPYAEPTKKEILGIGERPTAEKLLTLGEAKLESEYQNTFKTTYIDDNMYPDVEKDFQKLQRYYIPISPESPLKPMHLYENYNVLEHVGLNDMTLEYPTSFYFQHYLFGSGADDAFYIEQKDSRVPVPAGAAKNAYIKYEDLAKFQALQEERKNQPKVHKIRISDRDFIDKVKAIVDIGL